MAILSYELWNLDIGNCIGVYGGEREALAEVRAAVREDGPEVWSAIALLWAGDRPDDVQRIVEGDELLARSPTASDSATSESFAVAGVLRQAAVEPVLQIVAVNRAVGE